MTDATPPEMEETTVETYRDGVLVETRTVAVPKAPPSTAELLARIAQLEGRMTRSAQASSAIDPNATTGTVRTELEKVKGAISEMATDEGTTP